jgi:hypothetical protein
VRGQPPVREQPGRAALLLLLCTVPWPRPHGLVAPPSPDCAVAHSANPLRAPVTRVARVPLWRTCCAVLWAFSLPSMPWSQPHGRVAPSPSQALGGGVAALAKAHKAASVALAFGSGAPEEALRGTALAQITSGGAEGRAVRAGRALLGWRG